MLSSNSPANAASWNGVATMEIYHCIAVFNCTFDVAAYGCLIPLTNCGGWQILIPLIHDLVPHGFLIASGDKATRRSVAINNATWR